MLKLIIFVSSLFLFKSVLAQQKTEFKFSISSLDKSMFFDRLTYYVTAKGLIIKHGSDLEGLLSKKPKKAEVVFQIKLDSNEIRKFYTLVSIFRQDSLKAHYDNLCIMDGLILDFDFVLGNKKKALYLANYYVAAMQPFVDFVNVKVPEKYKIYYDKDLETDMASCPKDRLLEY